MKNSLMFISLLAAVAGLFIAFGSTEAQSEATATQVKIAVLDVTKAMVECQEYIEKQKETDQRNSKTRADMGQLKQEVDAISEELKNVLEPGSPEYSARLKEWFDKKASLESMNEYVKETLTIETRVWTETLYGKLVAAASAVARQEGYTLVLNKDGVELKTTQNIQELFTLIRTKQVIYNSATMDITGLVIEKMDAGYAK